MPPLFLYLYICLSKKDLCFLSFCNLYLQWDIIANWQAAWAVGSKKTSGGDNGPETCLVTRWKCWTNHLAWVPAPVVPLLVWSWARSCGFYCLSCKPNIAVWVDWNNVCENALKSIKHYIILKPHWVIILIFQWCSGQGRMTFTFYVLHSSNKKKIYKGDFPIIFCTSFFGELRLVQGSVPEAPARSPPGAAGTWGEGNSQMLQYFSNCCVSLIKFGLFPTCFPKRLYPFSSVCIAHINSPE